MKKLGLLLIACFAFAAFASAQNNIVKSLERNVPGQGKVTIHQDARIEALIGQEYIPNGTENRVLKRKKAGCLLTIGLKSPAFAVYSFNLLIDQLLQLIHKGTDIFKLSVYRRKSYIRHRIQILQMLHNDLSDLGTADLTVF